VRECKRFLTAGAAPVISRMGEIHHASVHFSGRVQGVGFRYAALQVAREFEVAGFVQNLPDGRVLLEVEGAPAEVEKYVIAVEERMHGYIRKKEQAVRLRTPQFTGFVIR
jgi:acylphosphatase